MRMTLCNEDNRDRFLGKKLVGIDPGAGTLANCEDESRNSLSYTSAVQVTHPEAVVGDPEPMEDAEDGTDSDEDSDDEDDPETVPGVKVKCDRQQPVCGACMHSNRVCIYNTSPTQSTSENRGFADFDISRAFSKLSIEPIFGIDRLQHILSQEATEQCFLVFLNQFTESAIRPYVPYEYILHDTNLNKYLDTNAVLACACLLNPKLQREESIMLSKSFFRRYYANFFQRGLEIHLFDSPAQYLLSRPLYQLDVTASKLYGIIYHSTCVVNKIYDPPMEPHDQEGHIMNCIRVSSFWDCRMADICIAAYNNRPPKYSHLGPQVPFPYPKAYVYDRTYPISHRQLGSILQPHTAYIPTPLDLDIHGCYMSMFIIQGKICELHSSKKPQSEFLLEMESILCALEDWRLNFQFQFPNNSEIESKVWVGMTESRYWALFLQLLIPKLSCYLQDPKRVNGYHVAKAVEATRNMIHIFRVFYYQMGISFESTPPTLPLAMSHVSASLAIIYKFDVCLLVSTRSLNKNGDCEDPRGLFATTHVPLVSQVG
ncbi:hypothetical protein EDD86DRAFT_274093 [Gorgonomyces haynaldii]|nr:hypothetical protein EDD86DRAFT_274093 [Gorgonomyces haynaldii]